MILVHTGSPELDCAAYLTAAHAVALFNIPEDSEIIISGDDMPEGMLAQVFPEDDFNFSIILNTNIPYTEEDIYKIIGHEMVHIKQMLFDGLDLDFGVKTAKYKGKYYRTSNAAEYWLSPWEIEARGYEDYFSWIMQN